MRQMSRDERRHVAATHKYLFAGVVERTYVGDELVAVNIQLMQDTDIAEVTEGKEFITLSTVVNPFNEGGQR